MDYLPEQLEHTLKNIFQPFGKSLRISWAVTFLSHQNLSGKPCAFLQINIEVAIEFVFYTEVKFTASTGTTPHIFSVRPPHNQKSSFLPTW